MQSPLHERVARLTPAEMRVLILLADGYSDGDIARELSRSFRTIRTLVERAYHKLELTPGDGRHPRVRAAVIAAHAGLVAGLAPTKPAA